MLIEIKKFLIDTVPGIFSMHRVLVNSRPGSRNFKSSEKKKKIVILVKCWIEEKLEMKRSQKKENSNYLGFRLCSHRSLF